MPFKCVVYGCSRSSSKGISLHPWPQDTSTAEKWKRFVKTKRKDWEPRIIGETRSRVCSVHFTSDCFHNYQQVMDGYASRLSLKRDAVPTIHADTSAPGDSSSDPSSSRQRPAYRKREVIRVSSYSYNIIFSHS